MLIDIFQTRFLMRRMPTGVKKRLMGHSINGDIDLLHYSALAFDDLKSIYDRYWGDTSAIE